MNSLSKVVVLFAVLGIIGAGLFFFPGSPLNVNRIIFIQPAAEGEVANQEMDAAEPASGTEEQMEETQ